MSGRVIQGFFIGGRMPASLTARLQSPIQRRPTAGATVNRAGPPPSAFAPQASSIQRHGGNGDFNVDPVQLGLARGGGKPLPGPLLAKMEAAFGADFSGVRVHVGPQAARIGAIAFTTGNDLYFAPGRYQPDSVQGQQLIGHELAHVVQQRQGRVRTAGSGVSVVQDHALEAEADRLGMRAAMHRAPLQRRAESGGLVRVPGQAPRPAGSILPKRVLQRSWDSDEDVEEDVEYGEDAEYKDDGVEDYEPLEYFNVTDRPNAYGGLFKKVYSAKNFVDFDAMHNGGKVTWKCGVLPCVNKHHSKRCNGYVYYVVGKEWSPTTPLNITSTSKKAKKREEYQRPPMCHIVDWVILRDALDAVNVTNEDARKFVCWGNLDNLTTGRMTCNGMSNKNQEKYDTISPTKKKKVDNYIIMMLKEYKNGAKIDNYGAVYA